MAGQLCKECGAPIDEGGSCRQNFEALLALEWQIPDGAGEMAHFYAVSAYILQHPDTMLYTAESLAWLRSVVGEALAGRVTIEALRSDARASRQLRQHVTRRSGDAVPCWSGVTWSITVDDVLNGGVVGYRERVAQWAAVVLDGLDALDS